MEHAWSFLGTVRRPAWLELSDMEGDMRGKGGRSCGQWIDSQGPPHTGFFSGGNMLEIVPGSYC